MSTFRLLFLGTSAWDYSPKLATEFKDCFDCDVRRSASALLDDTILIDCGFHCLDSLRIAKVDITKITDVFFTHLHADHCNLETLRQIATTKQESLRVWIRADAKFPEISNVILRRLNKKECVKVTDGLFVQSFNANHDESSYPQHLLFEKDGRKIMYACDGAWFLRETYYALKGAKLDLLVLDCTVGSRIGDYRMAEHNSIPMIKLMIPSLKTWGVINEETKVYISHIATSLHDSYKETVKIMGEVGVGVAYDGLNVEV